jgi:hypothetical protein
MPPRVRKPLPKFADTGELATLFGDALRARLVYDVLTDQRRDIRGWIEHVERYVDNIHVNDAQKELMFQKFDRFIDRMCELIPDARNAYVTLQKSEQTREEYKKFNADEKNTEDVHYEQRLASIDSADNYCDEMRDRLQQILTEQKSTVPIKPDPEWPMEPPWSKYDEYDPVQDQPKHVPLNYNDKPPEINVPKPPKRTQEVGRLKIPKVETTSKSDSNNTDDDTLDKEARAPLPPAPQLERVTAPPPPPPPGGARLSLPPAPQVERVEAPPPPPPPPGAPKAPEAPVLPQVVVWLFIGTQNRLVALHSALFLGSRRGGRWSAQCNLSIH